MGPPLDLAQAQGNGGLSRRGRPKKMGPDSVLLIKATALQLFASKGYANTSLDEVAANVGFTKGGLYYYFRSKEQLLLEVLEDIEARSIANTERVLDESQVNEFDKLALFIDTQAIWAGRNPADLAVLMLTSLETVHDQGAVASKVRVIYARMEALLTRTVKAAKADGLIRSDHQTRELVLELMANHDGNILLWYRSGCDAAMGRTLVSLPKRLLLDRIATDRDAASHESGRQLGRRKEKLGKR